MRHDGQFKTRFMAYRTPFGTLVIPNVAKTDYTRDNIGEALPEPIRWGRRIEEHVASRMIWHGYDCPQAILKNGMLPEEYVTYVNAKAPEDFHAAIQRWDEWYAGQAPWWLDENGVWQCGAWLRKQQPVEQEDAA